MVACYYLGVCVHDSVLSEEFSSGCGTTPAELLSGWVEFDGPAAMLVFSELISPTQHTDEYVRDGDMGTILVIMRKNFDSPYC